MIIVLNILVFELILPSINFKFSIEFNFNCISVQRAWYAISGDSYERTIGMARDETQKVYKGQAIKKMNNRDSNLIWWFLKSFIIYILFS